MAELHALLPDKPEFAHVKLLIGEGTLDREWVPRIAREGGWVVITTDAGRRPSAGGKLPHLCRLHKVTHIILSKAIHHRPTAEKRQILFEAWDRIVRAAEAPPGTRFRLKYRNQKGAGLVLQLEKVT